MLRSWVIVAVSVAAIWPAPAAYLPYLGPGPLRFERPARVSKAAPVAAPEATTPGTVGNSAAPAETTPATQVPPPVPPTNTVVVALPATNEAPAMAEPPATSVETATNQVMLPAASTPQASSEPEITPQMLVQYFKTPVPAGSTNGAGVIVTLPLFQPPQPARIPPSSARYETPEPKKPSSP